MSRKKEYINSVTQRLLDSKNFLSSTDLALHRFLHEQKQTKVGKSNVSFAECLIDASKGTMPKKFKAAYRLASDENRYIFGTPKSELSTSPTDQIKSGLSSYLKGLEGNNVEILYTKLNSKNMYHYAWINLLKDYHYNYETNEITSRSIVKGKPCYLFGGQLEMTQKTYDGYLLEGNLSQLGLSLDHGKCFDRERDIYRIQPKVTVGSKDRMTVMYAYEKDKDPNYKPKEGEPEPPPVILYESFSIDLGYVNPTVVNETPREFEWVQSMYISDGYLRMFSYEYLSGGILEIDESVSFAPMFGQYYPRLYIRQDADDTIGMEADNPKRTSTELLAKKLGMDLPTLTKNIRDGIGNVNNDIKYIFLHLTVSINKDMDDQYTARYLFNYFGAVHEKGAHIPVAQREEPTLINERDGTSQKLEDINYSQIVTYWKSGKRVVNGVATNNKGESLKVGEYGVKYKLNPITGTLRDPSLTGSHIMVHQKSSTQYDEVTVVNLKMDHLFLGKVITSAGGDENLTIPLDMAIVNDFNNKEQELLFNRALQLTVTTIVVVKQKWYQTGIFKIAMAAISIAINLVVPGSGLTLLALMEAIAVTLITSIAINIAINLAVKLGASLGLSPSLVAAITAVVAIAGAAYGGGKIDLAKVMNAKELLKGLNYAVDSFQKGIAIQINEIKKEMDTFSEFAKDQWEKLETAQELLNTGVIPPSLEMLVGPVNTVNIYLGETAEDFYTRSNLIDVVDMTENMVDYFIDYMTTVPKRHKKLVTTSVDVSEVLLIN